MNENTITVSTDGSALSNPNGPMGWAWADHRGGDADAGGASNGTNQIGELCAVLQALRAHRGPETLVIETDSQYAINCSSKWVHGWKKKGWRNSQGKSVKNRPLIEAIDREIRQREGPVRFVWVKGHAGDRFNEKVDKLARGYATAARDGSREGCLPIEGWRSLLDSPYSQGLDMPDAVQEELDGGAGVLDGNGRKRNRLSEPDEEDLEDRGEMAEEEMSEADDDQAEMDHDYQGDEAGQEEEDEEPKGPGAQSDEAGSDRASRGLRASGRVCITPPPSQSPNFAGKDLHISGTIEFSADIDQEGMVVLDQVPFRLHGIEVREQE